MKIITDLSEANNVLQSLSKATLEIIIYTEVLKKMALRIESADNAFIILIIALGCSRLKGKLFNNNANLVISQTYDDEYDETITKMVDYQSEFELVATGGFSLTIVDRSEYSKLIQRITTGTSSSLYPE